MNHDALINELLRPPLPQRLQVEVTAACNLRCRMCIVRYRPAFPRSASISFETFKRIVDGMPGLTQVALQGIGEPLLAPDLFRMIGYARERGIVSGFNTNATLLTQRAGARLIDAGLAWMCISLDGATQATYEFVRDGTSWDAVTANITTFANLLRERRAARPELSLVMVLMKRNLHELPGVVGLAGGWGIRRVYAQNLSHDFSDAPPDAYRTIAEYVADQTILDLPRHDVEQAFGRAKEAAARHGVELRLPHVVEHETAPRVNGVRVGCTWPWDAGYVSYDGTVLPCCMVMGRDRVELGNVADWSYAEIWESEGFREFRAGLVRGEPHPVCRGCSMYRGVF